MDQEPWFQPKRSGLGLTPISWQGVLSTIFILVVILATVVGIAKFVRDSFTAIVAVFATTGIELLVFIPWTYKHARRTRE
jgi:hypothetical protein